MDPLKLSLQIAQIATPALIGLLAIFIAYRQWRTAHERAVMDLFDRRMAIYEAAREVIGRIVRNGASDHPDYFDYIRATDRLPMLFGKEIVDYSELTRKRINDLTLHSEMVRINNSGNSIPDFAMHVKAKADTFLALSKFYEEFPRLLLPYVRMTQKQQQWPWSK